MATHEHIDRVCALAALLSLLLALLSMNGEALGVQPASRAMGYEAALFDTSKVHTIEIVMDDWDGFLESCENEEYAACSVVIDNEGYKNLGIRAKGNTSLSTVARLGSDRYSFKLEFDRYDSGRTYHGLDKLCLNNLIQDDTMMKDYLTYRLMAGAGVDAPLCSYVWITVNGEDWGLYLAVEGVEDAFLQRSYGRDHGELYKPDSMDFGGGRGNGRGFHMDDLVDADGGRAQPPEGFDAPSSGGQGPESGDGGSAPRDLDPAGWSAGGGPGGGFGGMGSSDVKLQYIDDDPDSYPNIFDNAKTDVSDADRARLIQALKTLGEGDPEDALDLDQVLRYFVVHDFLVNGDSYTGSMVHNYYLYEEDGRLSMIPWDYNLAYGTFQGSGASDAVNDPIDTPLSVTGSGDRPMIDWIFSSEEYTQLYHQYFQQFLDSADCAAIIEEARALIAPYVERDPTKFCTDEEFQAGVEALERFCALRAQSVSGQLAGSIPSTGEGQAADPSALVDASGLTLSDMGTMDAGGRAGGPSAGGDGTAPEGGGAPAFGAGDAGAARRPPAGLELPDGAPLEGGPAGGASAGLDGAALAVTGASAAALLAGLWIASRYRRAGGPVWHSTRPARRRMSG